MNAREILAATADWLGWQHEELSSRLRSAEDGIRLFAYAQAHAADVPEMADEWTPTQLRAAIGYNPWLATERGEDYKPARFINRSAQTA